MRVKDAKYSIYFGLKRLPWHPAYLAAMWILAGELRSLYSDWIGTDEVPLLETTMDLVREVVIAGESWSAVDQAEELADAWGTVLARYERSSASGGLLNVKATFEALAQEIARLSGHYDAGNWVTSAAADRWDDWDRPGPILVDPNEEADDSSPKAQTLASFVRVVRTVTTWTEPDWDPVRIRARIFGRS